MAKSFSRLAAFVAAACVVLPVFGQPADSPEEAGVTPVTGDLSPWRSFGLDVINYDQTWVIALNNGNIVAFKRAHDFQKPGTIGGSEFLMFGPDGSLLTAAPVMGSFEPDGSPTALVDYASTGAAWGAFTLGARPDRANGTGFVVHNQGEAAALFGLRFADEVGDEAFSLVQLFDNDGKPIGASINAFGTLTAEEGSYRDIGAAILSNGDIVVIGEDRQPWDEVKEAAEANVAEAVIAVILGRDGTTKVGPFLVHTDADGKYIGTANSSVVYENVVAFEGGFVIDYGAGIRWYNNDGTPRTPVQPDHAELDGVVIVQDYDFVFGSDSGGRGDGMALASNGKDLVVKSTTVSVGQDSIGVLIYYNTDGTVRNWVRFDDVDLAEDFAMVDRTFCDMDENGNVFVVWQDKRFGGDIDEGHIQIFGRFFDSEGNPAGPSFPVFENWRREPEMVDYGPYGELPAGDVEQPRCAINSQVAAVIDPTTIMPEIPDIVKEMAAAFDLPLCEAVIRIFKNPFAPPASVEDWSVY